MTNGVGNAPMTESTNKHIHPQNWPDAGVQDLKIQAAMKATQIAKPYPKIKHEGAKVYFIFSLKFFAWVHFWR